MLHLAMDQDGNEADKNDIILTDWTTGKKENITANIDMTVASASFSADGKFIYFISPDQGLESVFELDLKQKNTAKLPMEITIIILRVLEKDS
jgi:Tol biopolymer transport system component